MLTMRTFVILLCLSVVAPAFAQEAPVNTGKSVNLPHAEEATPQALTEAERCSVDSLAQRATIVALRAEVARLAAHVAELEAPLVAQAVATERQQLEQRFRERLKPPADHVFDWTTLTFRAPKVAPQP